MRTRISRRNIAAVLAVLLSGCSESNAPPTGAGAVGVPTSSSRLLSYQSEDGTTLSVVDERSGRRYSLSLVTNEFRRESDGMTVVLPPDVTDSVATALATLIRNDPSIESLESLSPPGTPGGGCTGMPGDPCAASLPQTGLGFPLIVQWAGSNPVIATPTDPTGGVSGGGKRGRGSRTVAQPVHASDFLAGDVCTNIINAALPQTIDYRGKRTSALDGVFEYGASQGWNAATKNYLVRGSATIVKLLTADAEVKMAGVAVGFLRGMWNDYGCSSQRVVAGPFYHSAAGGDYSASSPAMTHNFTCADETWQISWDNGRHFEPIKVSVCQFVS
jgi:hypothetical protein